jgi:hypothetical protein
MLEIEDMLTAAVTTFMARDPPSAMPDLDMQGMDPHFHPSARADRY